MAWQGQLAASAEDVAARLGAQLGRPEIQRRLRFTVLLLLTLWIARSLVLAVWSLVPQAGALPQGLRPINPAISSAVTAAQRVADIDALVSAQLFGDASDSAIAAAESQLVSDTQAETALAGIEDGAPSSSLPLILRGIVAVTDAGLGQAVIEHRNVQDLYRVGDDLPAGERVSLAKVMPSQVVIDNGGRYELLTLFEEGSTLGRAGPFMAAEARVSRPSAPAVSSRSATSASAAGDVREIAQRYRERLYTDPQSLNELVTLSVVREGSQTIGYRLSPGSNGDAFRALGFRDGDLVVAVNGISVAELGNIKSLYDDMRSADAASFTLSRGDEELVITVELAAERR